MTDPRRIDIADPETWPASAREFLARRQEAEIAAARVRLGAWVAQQGRVTFSALMQRALYEPRHGYYRGPREPIGPTGDFVTAPELHPAFGACVARWLFDRWRALGEPSVFRVVEAGGGTGAAAAQIVATATRWPPLVAALDYVLLEPGPEAAARQRAKLEKRLPVLSSLGKGEGAGVSSPFRIRWAADWRDLPPAVGVVWANELLDALPFHRVRLEGGKLREVWVRWKPDEDGGRFLEEVGPLSTDALRDYFARLGMWPPESVTVEVCLAAPEWLRTAVCSLSRGFLLLFDYGATAEQLYANPRRAGTLRAYRRHAMVADPLACLGAADLTADVDFTTLMRVAREEGLRLRAFTDQRSFLRAHGIGEWLRRPPTPGLPGHLRLLELLDPRGLGAVRVLELERAKATSHQEEVM